MQIVIYRSQYQTFHLHLPPRKARSFSRSLPSSVQLSVTPHHDAQFPPQQARQRRPVPQIHPFPLPAPLLLVLALTLDHIIVAFRARDGRAEPDLLVRRLLVEDVGSVGREDEVQHAGLVIWSVSNSHCGLVETSRFEDSRCTRNPHLLSPPAATRVC